MRRVSEYLLQLYVFTVPWDVVPIAGLGTLTKLAGMAAIGAAILTVVAERRFRKPDLIFLLAIVFTAFSALSLVWTISYPVTSQAVWTYGQLLGSLWVVREVARTREQVQSLLTAFCLGVLVPVASLLNNFLADIQIQDRGRYTADGLNADGLGILLAIGLPMAWHLLMTHRGTVRAISIIYLTVAPVGIMLTAARGAFLAGILAVSIVPLTLMRRSLRSVLSVAALLVVIGIVITTVVPESSWARIATIPGEVAGEGSMSNRRILWDAGIRVFPDHPLLGVGPGAFGVAIESLYKTRYEYGLHAHNTAIDVLVEHGIVGLVLFIALLGACALTILRLPAPERTLWAVIMLSWLIACMSASLERWKVTWLLLALLAAQAEMRSVRREISPLKPQTDARVPLELQPIAPSLRAVARRRVASR